MENQEIIVSEPQALILQGDPEQQVEFARRAAKTLVQVIETKPRKVIINGETYLEFEDWMMLARFWGASVGVEWTRPILENNKTIGYEARAIVHLKGEIISSAEAMCTREERNWAKREEFMLRSMAQTRASAKALRNVFAWVVVMAGYKPTPAEELIGTSAERTSTRQIERQNDNPEATEETDIAIVQAQLKKLGVGYGTQKGFENAIQELVGLIWNKKNISEIKSRLSVKIKEQEEYGLTNKSQTSLGIAPEDSGNGESD